MGETLDITVLGRPEYQTELLTLEKFECYWPKISEQLDTVPHIWMLWHTKESIYIEVLNREVDVWCVGPQDKISLVVFSRIVNYEAGRALQVWLAFGHDLERCLPNLMATLENFAIQAGCVRCEVVGRRGWGKVLSGFKETAVLLTRNLEHHRVQ